MSDTSIVEEEDPRDFRSPLDLELDGAALNTLKWLIIGHVLFVVGLAISLYLRIEGAAVWMTPLYTIPLVWAGRAHRLPVKALVLVVLFTAIHWAAQEVATNSYDGGSTLIPGLIAGGMGSTLSIAVCIAFGLTRPGTGPIAVFGIILLAAAGSFGVHMFLTSDAAGGWTGALMRLLWIYTPWQVIFAYFLAKTLKPMSAD
jgi:hypothetical protein